MMVLAGAELAAAGAVETEDARLGAQDSPSPATICPAHHVLHFVNRPSWTRVRPIGVDRRQARRPGPVISGPVKHEKAPGNGGFF